MDRVIIHSDANCFYASVEMLYHPEFAGKPLAVGGNPEARHGIVLMSNYIAKKQGVKTGMALWQARQACPDVIFVPPRMDLYLKFSSMLREIYSEYTDKIEPYGCDEAWLDVSNSSSLKGDGRKIANEISARVKKELGITVSEGISWNKIYAKLGSDYKKPDAITEFNRENYKSLIWKLPVSDLLYVGRSTNRTLSKYGIHTIGDLACTDPDFLMKQFGKMGLVIHSFANGWDESPVAPEGYSAPIKSIGNSTTTPRDLENDLDVKIIFMAYALQYMDAYDYRMHIGHLKKEMNNVILIYGLCDMVHRTMTLVKYFTPNFGEEYYDVLYGCYCRSRKAADVDIMIELGMSRATFYRKKKAALRYLGYYFFEIVVPQSANKRYKPSFPVEEE